MSRVTLVYLDGPRSGNEEQWPDFEPPGHVNDGEGGSYWLHQVWRNECPHRALYLHDKERT